MLLVPSTLSGLLLVFQAYGFNRPRIAVEYGPNGWGCGV